MYNWNSFGPLEMFATSSIEKEAIVDILYIVLKLAAALAEALSPSG